MAEGLILLGLESRGSLLRLGLMGWLLGLGSRGRVKRVRFFRIRVKWMSSRMISVEKVVFKVRIKG